MVFLALCAIFLAKSLNVVIGYRLTEAFGPKTQNRVVKPAQEKIVEKRDFSAATAKNIFGAKRENVSPLEEEFDKKAGLSARWQDAAPSALRAKLVGTSVFSNPIYSLASIEDSNQGGGTGSYSINECPQQDPRIDPLLVEILGSSVLAPVVPCNRLMNVAIIKRIEPTRVYFYNEQEGRYEYLSMEGEVQSDRPSFVPPPRVSMGGVPSQQFGASVKKTGPRSYEIAADDLNNTLNNLAQISTQARFVMHFEDGKPIGFKVLNIVDNSVFSKIGLQNGDVVTKINGYEINSPDKVLEIYPKLKSGAMSSMSLSVQGSNNTKTQLEYSIVGGGH